MAIIVENGSIVTGANSYVSGTELTTFATARGVTLVSGTETLLIQAMDYIENLNFKGMKLRYDQGLQWPRTDVWIDGFFNTTNNIPIQLKNGLMQTAIAIDQGNGPLIDMPRRTTHERVGELEVTYSDGASSVVLNRQITNALQKLLTNGTGASSVVVGKA